jgi:hypothetical protein
MGAAKSAAGACDDGHAAGEIERHGNLGIGYGKAAGYTVSTDGGSPPTLERSVWQTLMLDGCPAPNPQPARTPQ